MRRLKSGQMFNLFGMLTMSSLPSRSWIVPNILRQNLVTDNCMMQRSLHSTVQEGDLRESMGSTFFLECDEPEDIESLGTRLGKVLSPGDVILLRGK